MEYFPTLRLMAEGGSGPPEGSDASGPEHPSFWRPWALALADLLFPPFCPVCQRRLDERRRDPLCGHCWDRLERLSPPFCPICGLPFGSFEAGREISQRCGACRRRSPPFAYARSAALYGDTVREALHAFKFLGKRSLARPLGDLVVEAGARVVPVESVDCLVPVPLHPRREAERGFNQSALLARRVGQRWRIPVVEGALRRTRPTRSQTELSGEERRRNVSGAFVLRSSRAVAGRHVLLIDDILTTGSTVSECARILVAGGGATVGVLTVARVL